MIEPLSQILQQTGLVSATQLETFQTEHSSSDNLKVGEILVQRGLVNQKTVDFFTQKWPNLINQPRQPLGKYFREAGLLDSQKLQAILEDQKQTGRILGEIAVSKGWLKQKTVNFFVKHFIERQKHEPREELEQARSHRRQSFWRNFEEHLDEAEVQTIGDRLLENPRCNPFWLLSLYEQILHQGAIEVDNSLEQAELLNLGIALKQQGQLVANPAYQDMFNQRWLDRTLNYLQPHQTIHETTTIGTNEVGSWERLTAQVQLWTNGHKYLTQSLCQLLGNHYSLIPAGEEAKWVNEVIRTQIVENWEQGVASEHLRQIRARLTSSEGTSLLRLYEQILKHEVPSDRTPEQEELLALGLVVVRHNQLFVHNYIYRQIFNLTWVEQAKANVKQISSAPATLEAQPDPESEPNIREEPIALAELVDYDPLPAAIAKSEQSISTKLERLVNRRRPSKLSIWGGLIALGGLVSFIVVRGAKMPNSQLSAQTQATSIPAICSEYSQSRQAQIEKLRELQQQNGELGDQCQQLKNELLFGHAIETLASNNYRQEAVNLLCEVTPSYYENKQNLIPYFRNWSESSPSFKTWLDLYLQNNSCPAANYLI